MATQAMIQTCAVVSGGACVDCDAWLFRDNSRQQWMLRPPLSSSGEDEQNDVQALCLVALFPLKRNATVHLMALERGRSPRVANGVGPAHFEALALPAFCRELALRPPLLPVVLDAAGRARGVKAAEWMKLVLGGGSAATTGPGGGAFFPPPPRRQAPGAPGAEAAAPAPIVFPTPSDQGRQGARNAAGDESRADDGQEGDDENNDYDDYDEEGGGAAAEEEADNEDATPDEEEDDVNTNEEDEASGDLEFEEEDCLGEEDDVAMLDASVEEEEFEPAAALPRRRVASLAR